MCQGCAVCHKKGDLWNAADYRYYRSQESVLHNNMLVISNIFVLGHDEQRKMISCTLNSQW